MKNIISIYFFLTSTAAFCSLTINHIQSNKTLPDHIESVPFITSLIEGDQVYLDIPDGVLDQPMLFVRYDNSGEHKYKQVIWSVVGDKMLLKIPNITSTSGIILPIIPNLPLSETILAIFPTEKTQGGVNGHRINITTFLFEQDIPWKSGFSETAVPQISILLDSANQDKEVIIKFRKGIRMENSKISLPMYYSFCALGEPMKARRYDFRMGFFNEKLRDIPYAVENHRANIIKWRLEKEDGNKDISNPKKPITIIMSPDIPKKWRPFVKAGIEEWLPAFKEAGFSNAVLVKEVDSLSEWQANSLHTSVIYWGAPINMRGSEYKIFGGGISNIVDERTGEILKGDIFMSISVDEYSERYFVRSAPLDKRAQKFPYPDELLGKLYQTLVAHEVGHVFGLMDANFGKFSYPTEMISDAEWLNAKGHTPSVMNYTRSNNIAQPEDSIPPSLLIQKVGPIDGYNIRWAYTEFPPGTSSEHENTALERIIREQDSIPWYRFNFTGYEMIGPAVLSEVVVSRNPIKSTEMGLKNLKRVFELIPDACSDQKDNARLERLYSKSLELWLNQMKYVASLIGGYDIHYKGSSQPGQIYTPIPLQTQNDALDFLISNAFNLPEWLSQPKFQDKIRHSSFPDALLEYQQVILYELLHTSRTKRFEYLESLDGFEDAFPRYLTKLQNGLFRELDSLHSSVEPRNQELQMSYIEKLILIIQQKRVTIHAPNKSFVYSDYTRGLIMQQLSVLKDRIEKRLKNKNDLAALGHWKLCLDNLNAI